MGKTGNNNVVIVVLFIALIGFNYSVCGEDLPSFNSRVLKIKYQIPDEMKGKNDQVALWYRINNGVWQRGGGYPAGVPIEFTAPEDGSYEFSIEPVSKPTEGEANRRPAFSSFRCLIDFSKPAVQITDVDYRSDSVLIRWRAFDKNFSDRPIEIYLLKGTESTFLGKFPNRGAAILPIDPENLPAKIKVVAIDRAGNYGIDMSKEIVPRKWSPRDLKPPVAATRPGKEKNKLKFEPLPTSRPSQKLSPAEIADAEKEYKLGTTYRLRGELNLACEHLRKAVEIKPELINANLDLGDVFNSLCRYNDAIESYLQALTYDDRNIRGWFGLAMARGRLNQYQQTMFCLEKVVELDDKNIQGWLYLGDTYWTLGQRSEAKSAWQKVRDLVASENRPDVKAKLESRLKMVN